MRPAPRRPELAFVLLASGAAAGGCILDLDHLAGGPPRDGGGGSGTGSDTTTSTATSTGGSGGGNACSPLQCGACEGACPQGGCPPAVLANGPGVAATPLGIAVTPAALYWVNQAGGTVMRLADDGSAPEMLANATGPRAIAAGADLVVWTADDGVWACPPADCKAKKLAAPAAPGSLREVAYDGTTVFWTDRGTAENASDGVVMRCSPGDCQPAAIATGQMAPTGISILGDTLFWTYQADGFASGHVFKSLKLSQGSNELAAGLTLPTGLATDDINVYWTQWTTDGKVLRCPHSEGFCQTTSDAMPAAGALGHPRDVAVAGGRLYVSTADDGAIRSCPTPGCLPGKMPQLHTTDRQGLHRMVVGATCVFFTDESNGGSVLKVAR
jgi:sugar lactone lactonase YvrE